MQPSIAGGVGTSGTFFANTGVVATSTTICDIPQGTGESQRIGRKCTITNIHWKQPLEFNQNPETDISAGIYAHETIRIIIYWDKQCNGAAATALDILEANNYHSFRNLANSKRFNILYDKTKNYNTTASAGGNGTTMKSQIAHKNWMLRINLKCFIPIEYNGVTGALSEIRSNNIGIIAFAKEGGLRLSLDTGTIRIRFIDY